MSFAMKRPNRVAALRHALKFIAAHPDGCTEAILAAEDIPATHPDRTCTRRLRPAISAFGCTSDGGLVVLPDATNILHRDRIVFARSAASFASSVLKQR